MRGAAVLGVGYWSPGFASWARYREGAPDTTVTRPACEGVTPSLLRGTSAATMIAVDVLRQAARAGGADLAETPTIFGSTLGEVQTAVALNVMIRAEGLPSPMRFKNSVHNAPGGVASIAHANTGFTTSLSAGEDLVGACLLEALAWLDVNGGDVLVALAEEELPAPLPGSGAYGALGVALHLRAGDGPVSLARLRVDAAAPALSHDGAPIASALPLLDALASRRAGRVSLSRDASLPWCVDVVAAG